jgi:hypothetical protein
MKKKPHYARLLLRVKRVHTRAYDSITHLCANACINIVLKALRILFGDLRTDSDELAFRVVSTRAVFLGYDSRRVARVNVQTVLYSQTPYPLGVRSNHVSLLASAHFVEPSDRARVASNLGTRSQLRSCHRTVPFKLFSNNNEVWDIRAHRVVFDEKDKNKKNQILAPGPEHGWKHSFE